MEVPLMRRMHGAPPSILLIAVFAATALAQQATSIAVVAYENGRWFTGSTFESRTMYVRGDRFIDRPTQTDSVVDLAGGYVMPPFGEAHNHNVQLVPSQPARFDALIRSYMQAGVFYVQNPNSQGRTKVDLAARLNRPDTPDVSFANGGITGPGGHPIGIVQRAVARGVWTESDGAFLYSVGTATELSNAWSALLATQPDFVKIYLLYSEEYATRLSDPATVGWRGLNPALVSDIVQRAREAGLRVAAHVESAADFHVAVEAGVNHIVHMPGFRGNEKTELPDPSRYQVSQADAQAAARKGIVVVTTLAGLATYAAENGNKALRATADKLNRANLSMLLRNGVSIAIGSDAYDDNSVQEALYLASLKIFEPAHLLRSWSEITPRAIFPDRQIGRLAPGYEASFIVLSGDPLADFKHVTNIRAAMKRGQTVTLR
jgi:predicted amidohydrolase YtcJ